MDIFLQLAKEHGLFIALVAYVIWDKHVTIQKYLTIIHTLSEEVKDRLTKIESSLRRRKTDD
jgi:hypothetical protein